MKVHEIFENNEWENLPGSKDLDYYHHFRMLEQKFETWKKQFSGQIFHFHFIADIPEELKDTKKYKKYVRRFPGIDENGNIVKSADWIAVFVNMNNVELQRHTESTLNRMTQLCTRMVNQDKGMVDESS